MILGEFLQERSEENTPIALDESALSELVVAPRTRDGGVDLVRELDQSLANELIEAEAAEVIGAGPYERTEGRVTERNGHRLRTLTTKAGGPDRSAGAARGSAGSRTVMGVTWRMRPRVSDLSPAWRGFVAAR